MFQINHSISDNFLRIARNDFKIFTKMQMKALILSTVIK